jgi:hypothetical protein
MAYAGRMKSISGGNGMTGTYGKYRTKTPPGEFMPKGGVKKSPVPGANKGPQSKPTGKFPGRSTGRKSSKY